MRWSGDAQYAGSPPETTPRNTSAGFITIRGFDYGIRVFSSACTATIALLIALQRAGASAQTLEDSMHIDRISRATHGHAYAWNCPMAASSSNRLASYIRSLARLSAPVPLLENNVAQGDGVCSDIDCLPLDCPHCQSPGQVLLSVYAKYEGRHHDEDARRGQPSPSEALLYYYEAGQEQWNCLRPSWERRIR